ncbi:hypothetical protein ACFW04_011443 [Cataglyphis niger]
MMQAESVNAQKCCTKYQMLKRTYRMINDHNRKSGNSRKTWEYYKKKIPKIALMKKKLKRKAAEKRHSEKMQILN